LTVYNKINHKVRKGKRKVHKDIFFKTLSQLPNSFYFIFIKNFISSDKKLFSIVTTPSFQNSDFSLL